MPPLVSLIRSPAGTSSGIGDFLAEEVGFEPTVPFRAQRFSRPPPSTTRPLLRIARIIHRFSSHRSDEGGVTKRRRRRPDKARDGRTPQTHSCSTSRRPTERNAVRTSDFDAAVEDLCIVRAGRTLLGDAASSQVRIVESGVWKLPRALVFYQRVSRFRFRVSRKEEQIPAPIPEDRYNVPAVGALSAPLDLPFRSRSERATESRSGRPALGQSSWCLCVFVSLW